MKEHQSAISVIVLTKNNEKQLRTLLPTLDWCDEVIVIDDESSDNSEQIAKQHKASFISHPLEENFSDQRNFGLKKATNDWVLFLDSDEIISKKLQYEIEEVVKESSHEGYYIHRKDYFLGKFLEFGETAHVKLLRLGKRKNGVWKGKVHEEWYKEGITGHLTNAIEHYPHPTLSEFIQDINQYSTLVAQERFNSKTVSLWEIIVYPVGKFVQNYIFRQGFRDGVPGTIMAVLMSLHSFLVRGKLYLYYKQASEPYR